MKPPGRKTVREFEVRNFRPVIYQRARDGAVTFGIICEKVALMTEFISRINCFADVLCCTG
jgi:hypothetical protein